MSSAALESLKPLESLKWLKIRMFRQDSIVNPVRESGSCLALQFVDPELQILDFFDEGFLLFPADDHFVEPVDALVGFADHGAQFVPDRIDALVRVVDAVVGRINAPVDFIDAPALIDQVKGNVLQAFVHIVSLIQNAAQKPVAA